MLRPSGPASTRANALRKLEGASREQVSERCKKLIKRTLERWAYRYRKPICYHQLKLRPGVLRAEKPCLCASAAISTVCDGNWERRRYACGRRDESNSLKSYSETRSLW